jgi:hypothetical protein
MPETSNKIILKGLAFLLEQSGTLVSSGPLTCSGILPRRLHRLRGASVVRRNAALNRTEDPNVTVYEEATFCVTVDAGPAAKPSQQTANDLNTKKIAPVSKKFRVIAMLQSPAGATIAAMMKATGWQQHSVRGFLAGVVHKRLKLKLGSKKVDGKRVYQIASKGNGKSAPRHARRRSH